MDTERPIYRILVEDQPGYLQKLVQAHIDDGFMLLGGVSIRTKSDEAGAEYCQAVCKMPPRERPAELTDFQRCKRTAAELVSVLNAIVAAPEPQ